MTTKIEWEDAAKERMKKVPFFVRGFAKKKLENAALARGKAVITLELLEEIKKKEMGE